MKIKKLISEFTFYVTKLCVPVRIIGHQYRRTFIHYPTSRYAKKVPHMSGLQLKVLECRKHNEQNSGYGN